MNVADRMKHVLINLKALGISGANAANVVAGTDGPDVLKGRDGADNIAGQGGNDRLVGRGGRDKLDGGDGNDWLFGGDGNDELIGGLGKRGKLNGGNGDDLLVPGPGYDRLYGGNGVDTVTYDAAVKRVVVELEFGSIGGGGAHRDRLDSIENVVASPYDDIVEGSASSNVLRGGAGNDWLTDVPFATSKDRFEGGDGDDFLAAGRGKDKLFGGHGDDMLDGGGAAETA